MQPKLLGKRRDRAQQRYYATLKYQSFTVVLLTLLLAIYDLVVAYSALIGGVIYLLPHYWQARRHFGNHAGKSAQATLAELYAGQIWKMALSAVLFALAFVLIEPLSVFSLFAALILLQVIHLVMQVSGKKVS